MKDFYCDICGAKMILEKKFKNHKTGTTNYRRRRFKCTFCDYQKTIFADGSMDEKYIPEQGIDEAKKIAKQESLNRDFFELLNPTDALGNCFSDADPGL